MSSPTILTTVYVPFLEAAAANRADTARFLELARTLYDQAMRLQEKSMALGGKFSAPVVPYQEAEAKANALLNNGKTAGMEGVEYAHAYWLSLKHPWFDQLQRNHGALLAEQKRRQEAERLRLDEVGRRAEQLLAVQVDVVRLTVTAPQTTQLSIAGKVAESLQAVLRAADAASVPSIQGIIEHSASLPPQERLLALETFRLRLEQEVKQRRQQEALRQYEATQRDLAAERVEKGLRHCRQHLEALESDAAAALETEMLALASLPASVEVEERVLALEQRITAATRQQGLLEAAVAALRQQGYETVQVMQSLGPPEIASAYLQDPRDEGRVALLQVAPDRGLLSAEVVRRDEANGSQSQKNQDREAQTRLCKAMEAVELALSKKWQCQMQKQLEPGAVAPKVNNKVPAKGRRARVAAALQSRAMR